MRQFELFETIKNIQGEKLEMTWLKRAYYAIRRSRAARSFIHERVQLGDHVSFGPFALGVFSGMGDGGVSIGTHVYIDCRVVVSQGASVKIGSNCWIGGGGTTAIGAATSVSIGDDVIVSNNVHIFDHNSHPIDPVLRLGMTRGEFGGPLWSWSKADTREIVIENNVWIGEYAYIGKGVRVGAGSIIAAHAVVTRDVPAFSVAAGNPAVVVKSLRP
jgi:acetyltransferase-like isoleucine patch superfamily enzyme